MTWWQVGIVGWVAASLMLAVVIARAARPRARRDAAPPPVPYGRSDAVATILDVLDTVISEAERHPDAVARITGVEHLLSDGYGLALSLEAEWRRLGREVEELVDLGGDDAEAQVAVRQRRRREIERASQQLRERLELVWQLTQDRPTSRTVRPPPVP
jgi:hypothetical protein